MGDYRKPMTSILKMIKDAKIGKWAKRHDDEFFQKADESAHAANAYKPSRLTETDKWPCVGFCPDENGNLRWVANTSDDITWDNGGKDYAEYYRRMHQPYIDELPLESEIIMDPLTYADDENPYIAAYARALVNGDNPSFGKRRQWFLSDGSLKRQQSPILIKDKNGDAFIDKGIETWSGNHVKDRMDQASDNISLNYHAERMPTRPRLGKDGKWLTPDQQVQYYKDKKDDFFSLHNEFKNPKYEGEDPYEKPFNDVSTGTRFMRNAKYKLNQKREEAMRKELSPQIDEYQAQVDELMKKMNELREKIINAGKQYPDAYRRGDFAGNAMRKLEAKKAAEKK